MGLNLSTEQIAHELALNGSDVQQMTHSTRFLRNNRLRVDTPLPLRPCLVFGTQGHPMTYEEGMRRLPGDDAARSTVTV
jgi:hypothetical protein